MAWKFATGLGAVLFLQACSSIEPAPCTPEWVTYRRDAILARFAQGHGAEIGALIELKGALDKSAEGETSTLRMVRMATMAPKVVSLVEDFIEEAAPEVERAVEKCGGAQKASVMFAAMLRSEGVDEKTIEWVETVGAVVEGWNAESRS